MALDAYEFVSELAARCDVAVNARLNEYGRRAADLGPLSWTLRYSDPRLRAGELAGQVLATDDNAQDQRAAEMWAAVLKLTEVHEDPALREYTGQVDHFGGFVRVWCVREPATFGTGAN